MCDTLYKKIGKDAIFLKNSDRSANEPNLIVYRPARKAQGEVQCTYITIPDEDSFAVMLYKPSWIWGAEMGINEHGVTIGNEAVWTRSGGKKTERLLGMDLLRLGLERGKTAKDALEIIIKLLEKHGQGGNAGYDHSFYYDNSFLIADANEAYILETAGKNWAWKKVNNQANISNRLSLGSDYDASSIKGNFLKQNLEPIFSFFSGSKQRKECGERGLKNIKDMSIMDALSVLRSHLGDIDDKKLFSKGSVKSVCMHAGGVGDQTTGSMAVFYIGGMPYVWVTGSSTPCLSVFKPVVFNKVHAPIFENEKDSFNYFMQREKATRAIYAGLIDANTHRARLKQLEISFIDSFESLLKDTTNDDAKAQIFERLCIECATREQKMYDSYKTQIEMLDAGKGKLPPYWCKKSEKFGKNVFERQLSKRI